MFGLYMHFLSDSILHFVYCKATSCDGGYLQPMTDILCTCRKTANKFLCGSGVVYFESKFSD